MSNGDRGPTAGPGPVGRRGEHTGANAALLAVLALATAPCGVARAADVRWDLRLALEQAYDDNIIQLSPTDIDRLENPRASDSLSNRFATETPDDFVSIPRLSSSLRAGWLRRMPTTFAVDLAAHVYVENPVKDYQSYRLSITQPLHRGRKHPTSIRVSGSLIPEFYLRNLISGRYLEDLGFLPSPLPRREATYRKAIVQMQFDQEIVEDRLRFEGTWGRERRDYNPLFQERDSQMPFREAEISWDPLGKPVLRFRLSYRREDLHAVGDLPGTSFTESDVSSRRDIATGDIRVRWGRQARRKSLRLRYEDERRDFSTMNQFDAFHLARADRRRYRTLTFQTGLKKGWSLTAEAERDTNRSDFPVTAGGFDPDDTTDYTENVFTIGLGYEYGVSSGGGRP